MLCVTAQGAATEARMLAAQRGAALVKATGDDGSGDGGRVNPADAPTGHGDDEREGQVDEHDDGEDRGCEAAEKAQRRHPGTGQYISDERTGPLPGHAADSPANDPNDPRRYGVAHGHRMGPVAGAVAGGGVEVATLDTDGQVTGPAGAVTLSSTASMTSSVTSQLAAQTGSATLELMPGSRAAAPGLFGQLGGAAPSGMAGQSPFHTASIAPSGGGR